MLNIFSERGKFYRDWISKPLPIIIFGIGKEGKCWLDNLQQMNIAVEALCDNFCKGTYHSYHINKIEDLNKNINYMILITVNNQMQQYKMIQDLRRERVNGSAYIASAFKEFDFQIPESSIIEFRNRVPWFYKNAYQSEVTQKEIESWLPDVPLLLSPMGYYYRADYISENFNIKDKCRNTIGSPKEYNNCIYIFGDSRIYGPCLKDIDTIPSKVQNGLNKEGKKYKVVNCSVNPNTIDNIFKWLNDIRLVEGDQIILACLNLSIRKTNWVEKDDYNIASSHLCMDYINKINEYCRMHKAHLNIIILGSCKDIKQKWLSEVYLLEADKKRPFWNEEQYSVNVNIEWIKEECNTEGIRIYDYRKIIQRPHNYKDIFIDCWHYGPNGTAMIADAMIKDIILNQMKMKKEADNFFEKIEKCAKWLVFPFIESDDFKKYMDELDARKVVEEGKIGSIVMNANPFTKGHRWLAEYASKRMDWLYIMVVEEDKSEFSFNDRYEMVCQGTKDLKNVTVLRSGKYVISSYTFPDYFQKTTNMGGVKDINIFANLIAPKLNIKYRFIGTEPYSAVTNEYNIIMKKMLPDFGIECIEVERCKDTGRTIISASEVRKRLNNKDFDTIQQLVPRTTYLYLLNMYDKM